MGADYLDLYERASAWANDKVDGASDQLDAPTPCDGWDVRTWHADPDPREAVLADLTNGATSIWLAVGAAGTAVTDLPKALDGVLLDLAPDLIERARKRAGEGSAEAAGAARPRDDALARNVMPRSAFESRSRDRFKTRTYSCRFLSTTSPRTSRAVIIQLTIARASTIVWTFCACSPTNTRRTMLTGRRGTASRPSRRRIIAASTRPPASTCNWKMSFTPRGNGFASPRNSPSPCRWTAR